MMASKKWEIPYAAMLGIYREMLGRWRSDYGQNALVMALNIVLGAPPDSSRRWRAAQIEVFVDVFGYPAVRAAAQRLGAISELKTGNTRVQVRNTSRLRKIYEA
jgi:hypothetical protein